MNVPDVTIVKPGLAESRADTCCPSIPSALSLTSERAALIRQAFRLEWMTVAWMMVEGVVALAACGCVTARRPGKRSPEFGDPSLDS
jgi:hypothetical protein